MQEVPLTELLVWFKKSVVSILISFKSLERKKTQPQVAFFNWITHIQCIPPVLLLSSQSELVKELPFVRIDEKKSLYIKKKTQILKLL